MSSRLGAERGIRRQGAALTRTRREEGAAAQRAAAAPAAGEAPSAAAGAPRASAASGSSAEVAAPDVLAARAARSQAARARRCAPPRGSILSALRAPDRGATRCRRAWFLETLKIATIILPPARPPVAHRPPLGAASPRCARSACASARAGRRCGAPSSLHTSAPSRSSTNVGSARTSSTSPSPCARGAGGRERAGRERVGHRRRGAAPAHLHLLDVRLGERHARELGVDGEVGELRGDELANMA